MPIEHERTSRRSLLKRLCVAAMSCIVMRQKASAQQGILWAQWSASMQTNRTGNFNPNFTKSGVTLTWHYGDGTSAVTNTASKTYPNTSLKIINVTSPDGWKGVTGINLQNNMFSGQMPNFGANCPNLTAFRAIASNASFTGFLPSFAGCPNLSTFTIAGCAISGTLPDFSKNTKLTTFSINACSFSGPQPDFSPCSILTQLDISAQPFSGSFTFAKVPTSVTFLNIAECAYTGAFPDPSAYVNLTIVDISAQTDLGGGFTGICPSFAACTKLQTLFIDTNIFTGACPPIATLPQLQTFWCKNNQMTGSIPDASACASLVDFEANNNQFTATVAGSFATQLNLGTMTANNNALTSSAVNQILADLVTNILTRAICFVDLSGGTNGAPTGTGITNKTALIAAGWTVMTN